MSEQTGFLFRLQAGLGTAALSLLVVLAIGLSLLSLMASFGLMPWLDVQAGFGGQSFAHAGMALQLLFTALTLALCFFLPASTRVLRLEASHRNFQISMQDVAQAYAIAHREDREGSFSLSGEFDATRERIGLLRKHPDLSLLEPALLEVAAQMSLQSHELARVYSDEKVQRAKEFLRHRQQEVALFRDRMVLAQYACTELKHWLQDIEADEKVAQSQLERLERDLREVLPNLGYDFEDAANVVQMPVKPAK